MRLIGSRDLAPFPLEPIKRVRLRRRVDGYCAQFVLRVGRHIKHVPSGSTAGIEVGSAAYLIDSHGHVVANPRFIRLAEARLKRYRRRLSRRSVYHKQGKKPRNTHAARRRARQNNYPAASAIPTPSLPPHAPCNHSPRSASRREKQSNRWEDCIRLSNASVTTSPARRRARSSALTT
jgi:hypothetical protein